MSMMMGLGERIRDLGLSPEAMQGFMLLMQGNAARKQAEYDAMVRQVGHLQGAFDAHQLGQQERYGGYQRANEAIFGPGMESATSQLGSALREIAPILSRRDADLSAAMENAGEAWAQEDAMRSAGTRAPGGGTAFQQAMANAEAADQSYNQGREAVTSGREGIVDRLADMQRRWGEGEYGAGRAGMRAGLERDVGSMRGQAQDSVSAIRQWQAGQERPEFSPGGSLARAFGPMMMRRGLGEADRVRNMLLGGPMMPGYEGGFGYGGFF